MHEFSDYLHFGQKPVDDEDAVPKNKQLAKVQHILKNLYNSDVPEYLAEERQKEMPANAKKFIAKVGQTKGNGMHADQLDKELQVLFRKN